MALLDVFRFLTGKRNKNKDLRSERTKATQKAAGDTDISHMITPGVMPKEVATKEAKEQVRKIPEPTKKNVEEALKIVEMLNKKKKKK